MALSKQSFVSLFALSSDVFICKLKSYAWNNPEYLDMQNVIVELVNFTFILLHVAPQSPDGT